MRRSPGVWLVPLTSTPQRTFPVARPSERRCRSHIPSVILRTRIRIFTCAHVVNLRSFHSGSCRCMQWSGAVAELTTGAALFAHYSDGSHRNVNAIYGSKLASKKVTIKAKQSIQTTEPGYVASDETTCRCRCWLTSFFSETGKLEERSKVTDVWFIQQLSLWLVSCCGREPRGPVQHIVKTSSETITRS